MANDVSKEKLAAYIAAFKATSAAVHKSDATYGTIVNETLAEVEQACAEGKLGIRIMEFERDPDAN